MKNLKCKNVNCVCLTNSVTMEELVKAKDEERKVEGWFCSGKQYWKSKTDLMKSCKGEDIFGIIRATDEFDCPILIENKRASKSLNPKKEVEERKTFENFDASCLGNPHLVQEIKEFPESPYGKLILIGKTGTGKTHLAKALMNQINSKVRESVIKVGACELYYLFLDSVMVETLRDALEEIRYLQRHPFIFIDDLGDEKHNDSQVFNRGFKRFLDDYRGRYIITSNLNFQAMKELYGEKITSRLFENAMIKTLKANDYRLKFS